MHKRIALFLLLIIFSSLQMVFGKGMSWMPDLLLLLVVFTGIYRDIPEAIAVGIAVAFVKSYFTAVPIVADLLLFPIVGMISYLIGKMFFRRNPMVHIGSAVCAFIIVLEFQTVYMNSVTGSDISAISVIGHMWANIFLTALLAPVLFSAMSNLAKGED